MLLVMVAKIGGYAKAAGVYFKYLPHGILLPKIEGASVKLKTCKLTHLG
jgi:hypothetical protein